MILSKQPFQSDFKKPENFEELSTLDAINKMGLVKFIDAGFPFYTIMGQRILSNVRSIVLEAGEDVGFSEVQMPLIYDVELTKNTAKYEKFKDEFFETNEKILRATSEEYMANMIGSGLMTYNQLPMRFMDHTQAFRNISRPEGFMKTRQFGGVVFTSFDKDKKGQMESQELFGDVAKTLFENLQIQYVLLEKNGGVEFIYPSDDGEVFDTPENTIRGVSMGMGYRFNGDNPARFQSDDNTSRCPTIGTYGLGLQRIIYAALDANRDAKGFNLPSGVKPYEKAIILVDPKNHLHAETANRIHSDLKKQGATYIDDRKKTSLKDKLDYADFVGAGEKYILGEREYVSKRISATPRDSNQTHVGGNR